MKKLILFTLLSVLSLAGFSQNFGRLKIHSGLYDNFVINGPDTSVFGWRTDRFQLKYNTNKRFIDFIKADSSTVIYNKLILESPNDTMLSVRGNASFVGDAMVSGNFMAVGGYAINNSFSVGGGSTGNSSTSIFGEASGDYSFAGPVSEAYGQTSFSIQQGMANGIMSNAALDGIANGEYSVAWGPGIITNSYGLTAFGAFNDTTLSTSKTFIVLTDPLFQVANGNGFRQNAFEILQNGKTFIGNRSNTKNAILTVDPTDSTSAFIGNVSITDTATMEHLTVTDSVTLEDALFDIYNLAPDSDSLLVADDGIINLRTGAYGELRVWVFNAGMYAEYAVVILNVDGSIGIMAENSANVTNVGGTDGNLNIYDGGAYTIIENKLGGNRTIKYTFIH